MRLLVTSIALAVASILIAAGCGDDSSTGGGGTGDPYDCAGLLPEICDCMDAPADVQHCKDYLQQDIKSCEQDGSGWSKKLDCIRNASDCDVMLGC